MHLTMSSATTILPVDDPARAHSFYAEKLGLPHRGTTDDGHQLLGIDGGPLLELMPVSDGKHSEHTALSFQVTDIEATVRDMEARGIRFQDYDLPTLKTENHICTTGSEKCAWFMDTEHNILCIHQNLGGDMEYQV